MKILRTAVALAALTATARIATWTIRAAQGLPAAIGASARTKRAAAQSSPEYADGAYANPEPTTMVDSGNGLALTRAFLANRHAGEPGGLVPLALPDLPEQAAALAVTWYGHASVLIELDGRRVLADPVWGQRVSPSPTVGPSRLHPVPTTVEELPRLDAIVISHDHYDHLDLPTVRALVRDQSAPFLVPTGVGGHLRGWGVPEDRIVELDWGQETEVAGLRLVCSRARHFSGRYFKRNDTLWASWTLIGPDHRVYFGGDTGYTEAFSDIAAAHGPFDLTLLPIGAYGEYWPDIHMNPEEAVQAHLDLSGGLLVPIHWATFNLAMHPWAEPADRLSAAAMRAGVRIYVPRPGERIDAVDPEVVAPSKDWWTDVSSATR